MKMKAVKLPSDKFGLALPFKRKSGSRSAVQVLKIGSSEKREPIRYGRYVSSSKNIAIGL